MRRSVSFLLSLLGSVACVSVLPAQVAVTDITYGTASDLANGNWGGVTTREQYSPVTTVTTGVGAYRFTGPLATNVFARRNTDSGGNGTSNQASDNPNNTTIIYQTVGGGGGGANDARGTEEASFEDVFLSGNLYTGIRNPFANGAGTSTNSNVERIDFYFSGGYTVQANDAVVFFDVENAGSFGDGFRIAAYTAVGTVNGVANAPTTYANAGTLVAAGSFGGPIDNPLGGASATYRRTTFTSGDDLTGPASGTTNVGTLDLVGILIRFSDLGVTAGTTIYGYSLMAGDTTPVTASNLVNWNNTTYYPTNTDPGAYGNMDFMGFGAQIARPVPEPTAYGAIVMAAALGGWWLRRRAPARVRV